MNKNTYVSVLIQSLDKKIKVLDTIIQSNHMQKEALEDPNLDPDDFDRIVEKKSELIDELERLDNGFEDIFARVREELNANRDAYREEIKVMQEYIRTITDKSVQVQKQEAQNKELMQQKFASVRKQAREVRQSQKIVNQYYKNMMKANYTDPQFLDNKK